MDSYQAIYDAVRSRISNGDIGQVIRDVAWRQFDISHAVAMLRDDFAAAAYEMRRPSAVFKPTLSADGNQWCALLGENLQIGVAGFGDTPELAMAAFDKAFLSERTPTVVRLCLPPKCPRCDASRGLERPDGCRDPACPQASEMLT